MRNIQQIVSRKLCLGCGTCYCICPNSAITIGLDQKSGIFKPKVNDKLCNYCGICIKICPGYSVDFNDLNLKIFGNIPKNNWLGNYNGLYIGHSSDSQIRYFSSSGGMITSILIYALHLLNLC